MAETRTWHGSCHCGAVAFEARSALNAMMDCNCSRCQRLGWVMQPVPGSDFTLLRGAEMLKTYRFNTHRISHQFCTECGIEPFARGEDGKGNSVVMINVNCLEAMPPVDRGTIQHWDGRNA